jgi:hypothetical protein
VHDLCWPSLTEGVVPRTGMVDYFTTKIPSFPLARLESEDCRVGLHFAAKHWGCFFVEGLGSIEREAIEGMLAFGRQNLGGVPPKERQQKEVWKTHRGGLQEPFLTMLEPLEATAQAAHRSKATWCDTLTLPRGRLIWNAIMTPSFPLARCVTQVCRPDVADRGGGGPQSRGRVILRAPP